VWALEIQTELCCFCVKEDKATWLLLLGCFLVKSIISWDLISNYLCSYACALLWQVLDPRDWGLNQTHFCPESVTI
jgi:hypothetical protein